MANAVSGVSNVQQAAPVEAQAQAAKPAPKATAAPKDTVTISAAGQQAAHQAQAVSKSTQTAGQQNKSQAKK
ncbi:MAG: hypothetical protein WB780_14745 [Candidatus Acidiferrales bacterium]